MLVEAENIEIWGERLNLKMFALFLLLDKIGFDGGSLNIISGLERV